jgi:ATP-dependent DNA helicase DinG
MNSDAIDAILGPAGRLAAGMTGYEHRATQLELAHAVDNALLRDELLIAEAGTGTGKTLAYLVPALLAGKKVVISTGTKTLQDQIIEHDLPLLARHLDVTPAVASMKGLGNYLCRRRYEEFRYSADAVSSQASVHLPMLQAWLERTDSGDRAELDLPDDAVIWNDVQSAPDTRIGPKCRHFDACFVTRMRARAEAAQVVVVNHHLFFADLVLRSGQHRGGVIPEYDAVIFDEAHLIEDVATHFFGVSVSSTRLQVLLRDAGRALAVAGLGRETARLIAHAHEIGAGFFAALPRAASTDNARVPLAPDHFDDRLREPLFALDNALDALASFCKLRADASAAVAQIARRSDQLRNDVVLIADGGGRGRICFTQSRGRSVSLGASPVDVAALLREQLFYRGVGVVLTSATLSTSGSFDFLRSRLGIDDDARQLLLASPFDYPSQAALYLPSHLPDPREPAYTSALEREIMDLIELTGGGAFVLCTSLRMMRALASSLRRSQSRTVLMQGEMPSAALLERFRADGSAVLIASNAFWQGVDVKGSALRLVIIDKLPFDVPTDPLIAARCDLLAQAGQQPFMKYIVPAAALSLKQGFGRLIRSQDDRGIVAILDSRMARKGYGRVLERSLPAAKRCRTFDEVASFWRALPTHCAPHLLGLVIVALVAGLSHEAAASPPAEPGAAPPCSSCARPDPEVERALQYDPADPLGELEKADALDRMASGGAKRRKPNASRPAAGGCSIIEPGQRIWRVPGPAAVASIGAGFVVAGYAQSEAREQIFVVRVAADTKPEPITAFDVGEQPAKRGSPPALSVRDENDLGVAYVTSAGRVWWRRLRMGRAGHGAAVELASGADPRFSPALTHSGGRTLVAWTQGSTPMRTRLAVLSNDDAVLARYDLTPSSMGAAAATFVAGASPPVLIAVDARDGLSPLLRIELALDGTPKPARVAVPVSMVTSPPRLSAATSRVGTYVAYAGLGPAATSAVGLVSLTSDGGSSPVAMVKGTSYGPLQLAAAASQGSLFFAVDAPVAGGKDQRREVHVHVVTARGLGAATVLGPTGNAAHAAIAHASAGQVAVAFSGDSGVFVARLHCDDGG